MDAQFWRLAMFSVSVLLFGRSHQLAERCLRSIIDSADWSLISDIRIGMNEISPTIRSLVYFLFKGQPRPVHVYEEVNGKNVLKYPMMRRMLYDDVRPVTSPYIMWFDDDSYVKEKDPAWWQKVKDAATPHGMLGSVYELRNGLRPGQNAAIMAQPWYTGKALTKGMPFNRPKFCTGGWWVMPTHLLKQFNYPFPELKHNGGDSMLGVLCWQRGWELRRFNTGVAINANPAGVESKSIRRGVTTPWVWQNWTPKTVPDLSHHDFEIEVTTFNVTR